ncbi:FAST kinase domain-containing protein 1, mitochondrial-like [Centruroides vittatus]|uniref:FAST kinase domain-containing protein 1, mitochondrial-like n=1 Tax=Centruroides vittatus TaxID=120091 RepID=UPI00350ED391
MTLSMLQYLNKWCYFNKMCLTLHNIPRNYFISRHFSKCLENGDSAKAQLLLQLVKPSSQKDNLSSSRILKKLELTKSVQEVLLLTSFQNSLVPNELAFSLKTLKEHQYLLLSTYCWAYNNERILWVQSKINTDIQKIFHPLLKSSEFIKICNALKDSFASLSNTELLISLHSLLRLHFPCDHVLSMLLQQECLQRSHKFDLMELSLFASIGNMLQRGGIFINSLTCNHLEKFLKNDELTPVNLNYLTDILCHTTYFLSSDFIEELQTKVIKVIKQNENNISTSSLINLLEMFLNKLGKINASFLDEIYKNLSLNIETLNIHQLRDILFLLTFYNYSTKEIIEIIKRRAHEIFCKGYLSASDVVSFLNVFDICGWSDGCTENVKHLLFLHIPEFDVLLLKHAASNKFLHNCPDKNILDTFSNRVLVKLQDLSESISCLLSVLKLYSKIKYKNHSFHFHLRETVLQLIAKKVFHTGHLGVFYQYLLSSNHKDSTAFVINNVKHNLSQFSLSEIVLISKQLNFSNIQNAFTYNCQSEIMLKNLKKCISQRQNEIQSLKQLNVVLKNFPQKHLINENISEYLNIPELYDRLASTVDLKTIKWSCSYLTREMIYLPKTLQIFTSFIQENLERLALPIILSFLQLCALVNFTPDNLEDIIKTSIMQLKDENNLLKNINLLSLTHCCVVLGYFPHEIIQLIFSIQFVKNFDKFCEENPNIQNKFIQRFFDVNCCAVLECPEIDAPWFHQYFENEREESAHSDYSKWNEIVKCSLIEVLGGPELLKTKKIHYPYHYKIDMECWLTNDNIPICYKDITKLKSLKNVERIAILILQPHHLCSNVPHLLGTTNMKIRHLQLLGYRVVKIPYTDLNCFENEEDRYKYFGNKLFVNSV